MLRMAGPPRAFPVRRGFADHVCLGASPWGDIPQTGCGGNPQDCLLAAWEPAMMISAELADPGRPDDPGAPRGGFVIDPSVNDTAGTAKRFS